MCTTLEIPVVEMAMPKQATHTMRFDIVNHDGTVKRIEIDFCNSDTWSQSWSDALNIADMFLPVIYSQIVDKDKNAVGCQTSIIKKTTGLPIWDVYRPYISKPELMGNNFKPVAHKAS